MKIMLPRNCKPLCTLENGYRRIFSSSYWHAGDKGDRRYSSYSFLTLALDGSQWPASRLGRALLPGKGPPVPIVQEAGWASELVWTQRLEETFSASAGDRNPVVQSAVKHYTD
jgi:hypothetical protein